MLAEGLRKVSGEAPRSHYLPAGQCEQLGFPDDKFHAVTTGFCMRNVGNLTQAFTETPAGSRPGGRFVCLEFSGRPMGGYGRSMIGTVSPAPVDRHQGGA